MGRFGAGVVAFDVDLHGRVGRRLEVCFEGRWELKQRQ